MYFHAQAKCIIAPPPPLPLLQYAIILFSLFFFFFFNYAADCKNPIDSLLHVRCANRHRFSFEIPHMQIPAYQHVARFISMIKLIRIKSIRLRAAAPARRQSGCATAKKEHNKKPR